MQSRLQGIVEGLIPGIFQFTVDRIGKAYSNLYLKKRKQTTTSIRLVAEVSGAAIGASINWWLPNGSVFVALNDVIGTSTTAEVLLISGLAATGLWIGSTISKQALRAYHYYRYKVTNEEYIGLEPKELLALEEIWNVPPDLSRDVFDYLKKEITHKKNSRAVATQQHQTTLYHPASTKAILQEFRRAGEAGSLLVITDYFYNEMAVSMRRIEEIKQQIAVYDKSYHFQHSSDEKKADLPEAKVAELNESDQLKLEKIRRNLFFLQRNTVARTAQANVKQTVLEELVAKMKNEEAHVETIKSFGVRLGMS